MENILDKSLILKYFKEEFSRTFSDIDNCFLTIDYWVETNLWQSIEYWVQFLPHCNKIFG